MGEGVQTVFTGIQKEVPTLPYTQNALVVEFAAATYERPGATQFQCLLEGFDKDWSEWSSATSK